MEKLTFTGNGGQHITRHPLTSEDVGFLDAVRARRGMLETLAEVDEDILSRMLETGALEDDGCLLDFPEDELHCAIRRQTLLGVTLPVLCGAGAKNIGIQPLLDAMTRYLPSPLDVSPPPGTVQRKDTVQRSKQPQLASPSEESCVVHALPLAGPILSVLAFKVTWNPMVGAQTFVRVYSGVLKRSSGLFNTSTQKRERINKLLVAYADQYIEVESLQAGQIGVIFGFSDTRTGDTLVDDRQAASTKEVLLRTLQLPSIRVPPPVFSMSIEPYGKADEELLKEALNMLVRTDPSLHLDDRSTLGDETGGGQSILSGMGELHLEIAKGRLKDEFKVRAGLGEVRVNFRETLGEGVTEISESLNRVVAGNRLQASCTVKVEKLANSNGDESLPNIIHVEGSSDINEQDEAANARRNALRNGVHAALARGPLTASPMVGVKVTITDDLAARQEAGAIAGLSAVASRAVRSALRQSQVILLEPYMQLVVDCDAEYVGNVVAELTSERQGEISEILQDARDMSASAHAEAAVRCLPELKGDSDSETTNIGMQQKSKIEAVAPLANLVAYSSKLRALTAGGGTFHMSFSGFRPVQPSRQKTILRSLGRT